MSLTKFNDDGSSFRNQIYISQYHFELYSNFTYFLNDPVNGDQIRQKERRMIYGYNGSFNKTLSIQSMKVRTETGIGFRYDDITDTELSHVKARHTFLNPLTRGDVDQINSFGYLDVNIDVSPKIVLNAGVRVDAFSFQYVDKLTALYSRKLESSERVSPKLSLFYSITNQFQLYIKSGYGFHSNDSRVVVAQQARETLPKAFGSDLGVIVKPHSNLLANFAVWQLNLDQEFVYVGDEGVVEASGETQRYGFDVSVRYQIFPWMFLDFDSNYAYGRSVNEPEGQDYIPLAPDLTSIAGITAKGKNGLQGSLRYRYVSDRPANEDNSVQATGYFLLDATLSYKYSLVQFTLTGTNLLSEEWNEAQFDTETFIPGDSESISELTFTPGDPFFIKAGVTVFF